MTEQTCGTCIKRFSCWGSGWEETQDDQCSFERSRWQSRELVLEEDDDG